MSVHRFPTVARPESYSFQRYLAAKRTVDDRALHRPTLDRLERELDVEPLRVLEVGAGTGTMLRRLLAWDRLPNRVVYTGIDIRGDSVSTAREATADWARERGYDVEGRRPIRLVRGDERITVNFELADAFGFATREAGEREWDLLVAAAFLDLVDLPAALEDLFGLVAEGGLGYFPTTFDGETAFEPPSDPKFERELVEAYHTTMDVPTRPGASRTGRNLFEAVGRAGGEVLSAGGSDRVVHPRDGGYPGDEAYFLHHVVDTVESTVDAVDAVDPERLAAWADRRHEAIEAGELTYVAHQLDLLCRVR